MKFIINAASIFKGGAEQVVNSFIHECSEFPDHEYHIFLCSNIYDQLKREQLGDNFHFYLLDSRPATSIINLIKTLSRFDKLEKQIKPDCVISTGGHGYWRPKAPLLVGYNIPHYVYEDLPYMKNLPVRNRLYWKFKKWFDLWFYKRADALIVQTDDVNRRLSSLIRNKPVFTVSNTVNSSYMVFSRTRKFLPEKKENEIRLITLSANYDHKNLSVIRQVIPLLNKRTNRQIKFVLTLPEDAFLVLSRGIEGNSIVNVGPVAIKDCPALYQECDIMFLPTLLECFSASYAEAMVMKKPILTSDLPFARTVCGNAALYFNPFDAEDIASKIIELVENEKIYERLMINGENRFKNFLTASDRAKKILEICDDLIHKRI